MSVFNVPLFKDIGKTVTDLFKKKKFQLKRTLEVNVGGKDDEATWKAKSVLSDSLVSELAYKRKIEKYGTLEVTKSTDDPLKLELTNTSAVEGLKLVARHDPFPSTELEAHYCQDSYTASCEASYSPDGVCKADVAFVVGNEGVSVGLQGCVERAQDNVELSDYNAGLQYEHNDDIFVLKTANKCDSVTGSVYRKFSPELELGAEVVYEIVDNTTAVAVGGRRVLDDKSSVRAVLRSDGTISGLYEHKLSNRVTASVAATANARYFKAAGVELGYKLVFQ